MLAIIPARGGSKGLTRKNTRLLGGLPLICHTIKTALASKSIKQVIVSTDDDEIEKVCNNLNVNVFRRKKASNTQTTAEGLLEVLNSYKRYD